MAILIRGAGGFSWLFLMRRMKRVIRGEEGKVGNVSGDTLLRQHHLKRVGI